MAARLPPDPGIIQRLLEMIGIREPQQLPVAGEDPRVSVVPNMFERDPINEKFLDPTQMFLTLLDSLANAPFAQDTLFPLIGGAPDSIGAGGVDENVAILEAAFGIPREEITPIGVLGQTVKKAPHDVQINELSTFGDNLEDTFIHEFGHVLDLRTPQDSRTGKIPEFMSAFLAKMVPGGATEKEAHLNHLRDRLRIDLDKLREREDSERIYAATNPVEHFAVTFLNAINLLRNPELTQDEISEADESLPGVRNMSEFLMQHTEIFSGHPLNKDEKDVNSK